MAAKQVSLVVIEEKKKKHLLLSIERKKEILKNLTVQFEMLQLELDLIRHEYHVRIGSLLLKDNQLDLEIIQLKNLKRLMEEGMTYEEAMRREEDTFYNEILRMQKEQETIEEEKQLLGSRQQVSEETENTIKTIWKRLIRKFHPDLVMDKKEKATREAFVKKINKAYSENNLDALRSFEQEMAFEDVFETTVEKLEAMLVDLENLIVSCKDEIHFLQQTEWFGWKKRMEKTKKTGEDVFAQLEKNLLDDIVKKIAIAQHLRMEVNPQIVM